MSHQDDNGMEKRITKLERKERFSILKAVLSGLAAAIIALMGNWMLFESEKQERELKLLQIRAKHLDGMKGDYDTQKHTLRLIATCPDAGNPDRHDQSMA